MSTRILVLAIVSVLTFNPTFFKSQETKVSSYAAIFDTLYDQFGYKYLASDITIYSGKSISQGSTSINSVPTQTCQAGKFILHFDPGSIFTTSSASVVICQVLSDISSFINSPVATPSNPIHILCANVNTVSTPSLIGAASQFYLFPSAAPTNSNQGVIMGQVEKALMYGIDPYANFPFVAFVTQQNPAPNISNLFYSGFINAHPGANWNFNLSTSNIGSTEYDFYSVMLHEVTHMIGFNSLINGNGLSKFGASYNYFGKYDTYLQDGSGNPLLASTTQSSCPNSNIVFTLNPVILGATTGCTPNVTDITSNCATAIRYISPTNTSTANIAVYTPSCFSSPSSLSHFEEMCTSLNFTTNCVPTPTNSGLNDLYFVMCNYNATGPCYVKRYLKPEERNVLCDLGYSVNSTYSCSNTLAIISNNSYSYTYSSACSPSMTILGLNDGLSGGVYTYTCTGTSTSIPFANLLANDSPTAGLTVECIEHISGACGYTLTGPLTVTATIGSGLKIFKYIPKNSSGQFGNITYIYIYFSFPGCVPAGGCNYLENSGFEMSSNCGNLNAPPDNADISCWEDFAVNNSRSQILVAGCTNTNGAYNLGVNTLSLNPPLLSHNGIASNSVVLALSSYFSGSTSGDAVYTNLNAPLISGQSYNFSFWAVNHGSTSTSPADFNPNNDPVVITIASYSAAIVPANNFPLGLTELKSFTINAGYAWNTINSSFTVPVNLPPQTIFYIGVNVAATQSIVTSSTANIYCFIDALLLNSVPNPTFSFPSTTVNCSGTGVSYTNLAQYASGVTGVFSGSFVTTTTVNNQALYHFNLNQTILPAGTYPIAFTYTLGGGCTNTVWHNLEISTTISVSASGTSTFCTNTSPDLTLTAIINPTLSGATFTWMPGNVTNSVLIFSPNVSTIYTISASFNNYCSGTNTVAVDVYTNCCFSNSYTPITTSSYTNNTALSGHNLIFNSFTVQPGATLSFHPSEYRFLEDVKITISNGALLEIYGSHLYSCANKMWTGIVVEPGGKIRALNSSGTGDNLIEDAKTAIDLTGHSTSSHTLILDVSSTTFNKNYISIKINNYQTPTLSTYPFIINNCVFTCRDLNSVINATSWPQVSTNTINATNLRTAINSTTGLAPPYLTQTAFSITGLKSPYTNQTSKYAIQLNSVGQTTLNNFYSIQIGDPTSAASFNLFDAHEIFIYSTNSNVKSYNNVFQNTKHSIMSLPGFVVKGSVAAIVSNVTTVLNNNLDLTSTDFNKGNRFWNCHKAIMGNNVYRFNIEKAIFRSTQSTSPASGLDVGRVGIQLNTNRMQYFMRSNEFSNIGNCISVPIVANSFTSLAAPTTTQYGVYAANVAVLSNTISIGSGTNNFINNAINVSAVNGIPWTIAPDYTTSTLNHIGIKIENNSISDARRGIYVENVTGFVTEITDNKVALVLDNLFGTAQHAIHLTKFTAGFNKWQHSVIGSNTLNAQTVTNTLSTLVFCGSNPGGPFSPSVSCNDLSDAYRGFVFEWKNFGTFWQGNKMDPMPLAVVIHSFGEIGTQGSPGKPIENEWRNPSAWTSPTYTYHQTYMDNNSDASNSKIYVRNTNTTNPTLNSGNNAPGFWYSVANGNIFTTTGSYDCGEGGEPSHFDLSVPEADSYDSDELLFNVRNSLYLYLHFNDSLRVGGTALGDFYADMTGSTMGDLMQAEEALYEGDYNTAKSILSGLTSTNTVEDNYITFYTLYANYQEDLETEAYYSGTDSTQLFELANLCPVSAGHVVYQARALYFSIYGLSWQYPDCSEIGARYGTVNSKDIGSDTKWVLRLYPNPGQNKIVISSNIRIDNARLIIHDLQGREILRTKLFLSLGESTTYFDLINGAYFITLINERNEKITKKLFIAK